MAKKPALGLILAPLIQIQAQKNFLQILPVLHVRHCFELSLYAISRKTNGPNLRKWQKTYFQTQFWPLWPKCGLQKHFSWILLPPDVRNCYKLSLYAISRKTNKPKLRKWQKNQFWAQFWFIWPTFGPQIFFPKSGSVSHQILWSAIIMYNIKKKLIIQS